MKALSSKYAGLTESVTLAITAKAGRLKAEGEDVVFFSIGEPDFITPEHIREAAKKAMDAGYTKYTAASGLPELKDANIRKLARDNRLQYERNEITVSNGAKHALFNTLQAICNPGDEVIIGCPYWVSYPELVKMADGIPVFIQTSEENDFKMTVNHLESKLTARTKAIILNSPNNPTGSVYSRDELEAIGRFALENDLYLISDEIYEKLIYEGEAVSIASLNKRLKERTIVINGLSKSYAMTGWRIGYSAANREITKIITNIQSHATSNPNTIAQYAAICALSGDETDVNEMKAEFLKRRNFMAKRINDLKGVSCRIPHGAFYFMMNVANLIGKKVRGKYIGSSLALSEVLLDELKVAVVPGEAFGQPGFIRLSYATSQERIQEGMNRMAGLLSE